VVIDRVTASRSHRAVDHRHTSDAYGQRQISTMYTQLTSTLILEPRRVPSKSRKLRICISSQHVRGGSGRERPVFLVSGPLPPVPMQHTSVKYTPSSMALSAPQNAIQAGVGARGTSSRRMQHQHQRIQACPSVRSSFEKASESLPSSQGQFPAVTVSFNWHQCRAGKRNHGYRKAQKT